MNRLALLAISTGLLACGGNSKNDTTMADPCSAEPCADPCADPCGDACGDPCATDMKQAVDWAAYESWTKLNNAPFESKGHKKPWVNVYVTTEHAEAYKAASGEMPEGMSIVKSIHKDAGGSAGEVMALTVMTKMGSDYDPDNGNWYYAVMSPDASKTMQEGKLEACINCHTGGEDYTFASDIVGK